ncbi:hypothetical protein GF354_01845, partial [Candidatus Peregrinibacteria bacterium]|nr:hypothetical protein [Candidatus Peregrinibacteria bacterium]
NNFPDGRKVNVEIDAEDIRGRIMSTYRFSFNEPIVDGDPPYITSVTPVPGTDDVALDSNISFHLKDDISGVDIDTVEITVNGQVYRNGDFSFSYPEDINDYFIIVNPSEDFPFGEPVYVQVDALDFDGNVMPTYMFSFNHTAQDTSPPYIVSTDPKKGAKNVPLDSNISFVIRDNLSGVNFDSVNVLIEGVNYNSNHTGFSYNGDTVTINPDTNFAAKALITVKVDASDVRGNAMATYIFSFNEPPVCGDNRLEPAYEQCEPPGSSGCNEDCELVLCQALEESQAICGNNIVEPGEDCEPPGVGNCVECQLPEEVEEISDDQKLAYENISQDTDGDGLTDAVERIYGTDINSSDTDGDGISDLEEILELGTDPLVAEEDITIRTKIVNLTDGTTVGSGKSLFVKGISHADKTVRVFAKSVDSGTEFYLGEIVADEANKFLVVSETDLDDGDYDIIARAFEQTGEAIDESSPVNITVNSQRAIPAPEVVYLDETKVELDTKKLILRNPQPVVYGYSLPSSRVFMTVESTVLSSTIVADSATGYFSVFIPRPLEVGPHKITVYAVSDDGITSEPEIVEFDVVPGGGIGEEDSNLLLWVLGGLIVISLLVAIGYVIYRKWRKRKIVKQKVEMKKQNDSDKKVDGEQNVKGQIQDGKVEADQNRNSQHGTNKDVGKDKPSNGSPGDRLF